MPYIPFTNAQKQQAASVDLAAFLRSRGEELLPSGRELRLASDHSVTVRGSEWFDHATQRGGGPVSFVRRRYGLSYPEAMQMLLGNGNLAPYSAAKKEVAPPKPFALPPAHTDMRRVYAYLVKQRGIDRQVVTAFAKAGLLYEDAEHHNCVFVGQDETGVARHAHLRSTNSTGKAFRLNVEGGDPRCSFHYIGTSERLYVFEAPIDLLSYISLHPENWQQHSYVACCGVSFQPVQWLVQGAEAGSVFRSAPVAVSATEAAKTAVTLSVTSPNVVAPSIRTPNADDHSDIHIPRFGSVFLCLDNDKAGHLACERMAGLLAEQGIFAQCLASQGKDWNDDLVSLRQRQRQNVQMSSVAQPYAPQTSSSVEDSSPKESEVTICQTFGF